jgi:hypothetical protein
MLALAELGDPMRRWLGLSRWRYREKFCADNVRFTLLIPTIPPSEFGRSS